MLRLVVRLILRILFRVRLEGSPPPSQPARLLILANHQSLLDGVLLGAFLPYEPTWVIHTDVWRKWHFRIILRWFRHVVVDTSRPQAVRVLVREIEQGNPVVIFPEGRVTTTGGLMKIYDSPAFLAAHTGAALLPVSIDGAVYSWFSRMKRPFPKKLLPRIRITVLPIRYLPMPEASTGKLRRRMASRQMRTLLEETHFASRERKTIFGAFLDAVMLHGRRAKILDDVSREGQSYGDLLRASLALGRLVSRLSGQNEVVGVLMPNAGATAALLLGMFTARRVPAMLNYTSGLEGMQSALRAAAVRTIVTSRAFLERAKLTQKVEGLREVRLVYLEDLRARFGFVDRLWLLGWALRFPGRSFEVARPEDPAVVLFTSGSEGKPKGVVLSHDSILANVAQLKAVIEFNNLDRILTALPLFHSFGLTAGLLTPVVSGCRIVLYPSPLHYRTIPELTYDRDCTALLGTPTFLAKYGQLANPFDFYRLRYVIAGAEKLSEEVRRLWHEKFGIRILEGYGATECAPVIAVNTLFENKLGTVGRVLAGIDTRVVPAPGIDPGGELHLRGPNLMLGYMREEAPGVLEPPRSSVGQGWYATGDVVTIDEEGFVRITGRLKRFAKIAGEMIQLELVERIAAAASPAHRSAATTRATAGRGELIVLFTEDPHLRREDLVEAARKLGLPELAVARRIEYVARLPVLASGKYDYVTLQSIAGGLP